MTTVLVCGGRDYSNFEVVCGALAEIHKDWHFERLIHGDASGADRLAGQWALFQNIQVVPYAADWNNIEGVPAKFIRISKWGKQYDVQAGFKRNQRMLIEGQPHLLVAFPGGKGTEDMMQRAAKDFIPRIIVNESGQWRYEEENLYH